MPSPYELCFRFLFRRHLVANLEHQVYKDAEFQNWGLNVSNTPQFTCVPTTTKGVQNIVKYAAEHNMRVRCSGYRASIFRLATLQ